MANELTTSNEAAELMLLESVLCDTDEFSELMLGCEPDEMADKKDQQPKDDKSLEAAVLMLLALWERLNEEAIRKKLILLIQEIIDKISKSTAIPPTSDEFFDLSKWRDEITGAQDKLWSGAVVAGLSLMAGYLWLVVGKDNKPPSQIGHLNAFLQAQYNAWLNQRRATMWQHVTKGFRDRLDKQIAKAIADKISTEELAKRVAEEATKWTANGAKNIATAEMNGATNFGYQLGMQAAELQGKQWRNPLDKRTRRPNKKGGGSKYDHWKPNGQLRSINQPFLVSGESLMFPCDWSMGATIGNIAGCRCWTAPFLGRIP